MITNPNPVTPGVFDGMWVTSLRIVMPSESIPNGQFMASLLPYDGNHCLSVRPTRVSILNLPAKLSEDATFAGVMNAIGDEVCRQADKTGVATLTVSASNPQLPTLAVARFQDGSTYAIPDCIALCGTDATFAGVFQSAMAEIARQAGLSME